MNFFFKQIVDANNEVAVLQEGLQDKGKSSCEKENFLSSVSRSRRRKQPTSDELSMRAKRRRLLETYNAATEIHGGTKESNEAAATGLVETLDTKFSKNLVSSLVCNKSKRAKKIKSTFHKAKCKVYENSDENILRSVSVSYSMGVMGKRKYMKVRHSFSFKKILSKGKKFSCLKVANCRVPALLPYYKLVQFLDSVNIGTLHSVREELCFDLNDADKVNGYFRNLKEFMPRLAEFYLKLYPNNEFDWFGKPFTFKVAIGGDGAPFGKYDQACSWLVSFLNVGKRCLSSDDNFLIFGANCSESCIAVQRYVTRLVSDIAYLEDNVFPINGYVVKFEFSEIPNDMKMLCFLGGELSNSAKYFSSFGNVTHDDMANLQFTFGRADTNQWKPWDYGKRVKVVKQVEELKSKLAKTTLSASTKRGKITSLIAEKQSRQEFAPRIGKLIEKAHVEPLHLKNNACALLFSLILEFSIEISKLPQNVNEFQKVSTHSPFFRLITSLKTEASLSPLAKKVVRWFDEGKGNPKAFSYRFTGEESRRFLHNFMFLMKAMKGERDPQPVEFKLHVFAFTCLSLRDAVSLFCRLQIEKKQLDDLEKACQNFFISCALFLQVNPSVWTLGHVVPVHTREMFEMYGKGLALNSMEGREAKHQAISRYAQNSNFSNRWKQVFRHEFISLIWLREKGCNLTSASSNKETYIPKRAFQSDHCYCGLPVAEKWCEYCNSPCRTQITKRVQEKYVSNVRNGTE